MLPLLRRYLLLALSLISFTLQARNIITINNQHDFGNLVVVYNQGFEKDALG